MEREKEEEEEEEGRDDRRGGRGGDGDTGVSLGETYIPKYTGMYCIVLFW